MLRPAYRDARVQPTRPHNRQCHDAVMHAALRLLDTGVATAPIDGYVGPMRIRDDTLGDKNGTV
jgi:hypothetical protein